MPDERDEDLSQLELPSVFRRKKKAKTPESTAEVEPAEPTPQAERADTPEPQPAETTAPAPEVEPVDTPETDTDPATTEVEPVETPETDTATTEVEPADTPETDTDPTTTEVEPAETPETDTDHKPRTLAAHFSRTRRRRRPAPVVTAADQVAAEEPVDAEHEAAPEAESDDAPTRRLPRWRPSRRPRPQTDETPVETAASETDEPRGPSLLDRLAAVRLPEIPGQAASAIVGAVTGLVAVLLVMLAQTVTDAVRGTSNAGAAGFFLVVGIIALAVFVGAAGLRAFGQSDVLSTSFLGTGLVTVLVMLFLLPAVDRWWMVIVIPALGAAAYALSWWVGNRLGPEARRINDEYSPETHR